MPEGRELPFLHNRGLFEMPQTPGLGYEIDHKALEKHGRRFFAASRKERHWMPEALADLG